MNWLKKAPTGLVITVLIVFGAVTIAYLGGFVYLTANDKPTSEYTALLNSTMNWITIALGGTAAVASVQAARSASNAEDNTNGALSAKTAEIADAAVQRAVERTGEIR